MNKGIVKIGQVWKDKKTGRLVQINQKATNNHWAVVRLERARSSGRHLHEGTLQRFYELHTK